MLSRNRKNSVKYEPLKRKYKEMELYWVPTWSVSLNKLPLVLLLAAAAGA
jgi:hypothetical protein